MYNFVSRRQRNWIIGFTLIEMLVTIGLISILIGLALPAVQRARDSANRATCLSRLASIGKALHQYHDNVGCLPPGIFDVELVNPATRWGTDKSVYVRLLPYLEQDALFDQVNFSYEIGAPPNHTVLGVKLTFLTCPSDSTTLEPEVFIHAGPLPPFYASSFSFSAGRAPEFLFKSIFGSSFPSWAIRSNDGCFSSLTPIRLRDVTDGLGSTMFAAEVSATLRRKNLPQTPFRHWPSTGWCFDWPTRFLTMYPPIDDVVEYLTVRGFPSAASSEHPGTFAILLGDGSVRTVSKKIDSWSLDSTNGFPIGATYSHTTGFVNLPKNGVWQSLSTRAGDEIISNGDF